MEKHNFVDKTKEAAVQKAIITLQELEKNLIIKEKKIEKGGIFKSQKVEIEVIEKKKIPIEIKKYLSTLLKNLGFYVNIEVKFKEETPIYTIYSNNDSLLIGKNGKNLQALSIVVSQYLKKELGENYKFLIDVNCYKEKHERSLERLAKNIAKEVISTKIAVKLDCMNSYERRIIHNTLATNNKVYTESEGEEPNRYVVVKPKEE